MEPVARLSLVIPALNEQATIGDVVREVKQTLPPELLRECIVVDNGSTDATAAEAESAGAVAVVEAKRGYGYACAAGVSAVAPESDVILFMDGDGSDEPAALLSVAGPVLRGEYDFVLGSRLMGSREAGSMLPSQVLAGRLAGALIRSRAGFRYTDMGPCRAISRGALALLHMSEMTYGWNLEMQIKALREGLRVQEVPVPYRCRRGGVSKVSGSLAGSARAATRIAEVFLRLTFRQPAK